METNAIVPKEDGYLVSDVDTDKQLTLSNAELFKVGCKSCVWKYHGQCYHPNDEPKSGVCNEMINFLFSLIGKNDSTSALWEKYHIYEAEIQQAEDYADFLKLNEEVKNKETELKNKLNDPELSDEASKRLNEELGKLKMDKTSAKMWWIRLNDHVIKSLQKVVDREQKAKEGAHMPGMMRADTINFINKVESTDVKQVEKK